MAVQVAAQAGRRVFLIDQREGAVQLARHRIAGILANVVRADR